ncbi:hypothetical protein ENUP19_0021G0027 [Entamoeba nuttalli]|uniref:BTB domain-containing protein n=1 Tax=Entamoeba nuttalli TaxID=412467 RepID=A0ABQ0D930_9EUKA
MCITTEFKNTTSEYDMLSDKYKLLFYVLNDADKLHMKNTVMMYASDFSFNTLFNNYNYYHCLCNNKANIIELLFNEYVTIISILYKTQINGLRALSEEVIDRLLLYIDDWCLRDGISLAWDVAEELYEMALEKEELEEEMEETVFHWEFEDSSLSELDLNKP